MTKKWTAIRNARFSETEREELDRRVQDELRELNLTELRNELGLTQVEVARAAEMSQGELSRVERRGDVLMSTLRRCVEALGGELEVTAVIRDKRVRLRV